MDNKTSERENNPVKIFRDDLMVKGIVHDLNNILATILGYAEMLHEDLKDESPMRDKTSRIISAIEKAKSIANQLIVTGEKTRQISNKTNVDLILKETVEFFRYVMPEGVRIDSDIPPGKYMIIGDPDQIFRIFLNLIINAIQSMKEKGGILYLSISSVKGTKVKKLISRENLSDEYVHVTLKDTGYGMDSSIKERVFEPYYSQRPGVKGSGLGLYLVKEIVNELGGEILLSSHKNIGSVFDLYFPAVAPSQVDVY
jgi:signal transduction histidine kinase